MHLAEMKTRQYVALKSYGLIEKKWRNSRMDLFIWSFFKQENEQSNRRMEHLKWNRFFEPGSDKLGCRGLDTPRKWRN